MGQNEKYNTWVWLKINMQLHMRIADGQQKQTTEHSNDEHCKIHYNLTMQLICKWLSVINLDAYVWKHLFHPEP